MVDFDAATRDPAHPAQFLPQYNSGDHLHPNDAGYKAMGEAIDLALFKAPTAVAKARAGRSFQICNSAGLQACGHL